MADYFGNRYWTAKYFPAGYWGVDEPAPEGAIYALLSGAGAVSATLTAIADLSASLSGAGSIVAELDYVAALEVDYYDTHDGKPRVNPQDIIRERYLQQKRDLAEIIEKRFKGDDVSPAENPLPAELTKYLSPSGAKYMARREAERMIRDDDDEFAIVLALMN